jgi:predicted TIM-barrel fold metal-dependent hydrolase
LVPASQIVFGTDYPFGHLDANMAGVQTSGLTDEELRGAYRDNTLKMLAADTRARIAS